MKTTILLVAFAIIATSSSAQSYFEYNDKSFTVGQKKRIQIIYSYNKARLINSEELDSSFTELSDFLKTHPNIKIEIGSHTDFRGGAMYNTKLSDHRARSACDYLIKKYNVDSAQLSYNGYGEGNPTVIDAELHDQLPPKHQKMFPVGTVLNESFIKTLDRPKAEVAHQINRRTELTIVSTTK